VEAHDHAGWDPQSGADKTVIRRVRAEDAACLCDLYNYFDIGYWELLIESNAPGDGRAAKKGGDHY